MISAAMAAALVDTATTLAERLPSALKGHVPAVHRCRVTSRRAREVLALIAHASGSKEADRLRRKARRVTRALGPVREIDVALAELDARARQHGWAAERVAPIRRHLEREHDARSARLARMLSSFDVKGYRARCIALSDACEATAAPIWSKTAARRIARRARAVVGCIRRVGVMYVPERLHALRIGIKKLRYALELVPVPDPATVGLMKTLKRLQGRLGQLHDWQVLIAEAERVLGGRGRGPRHGRVSIVETLDRDCRLLHATTLSCLPPLEADVETMRRHIQSREAWRASKAPARRRPRARIAN